MNEGSKIILLAAILICLAVCATSLKSINERLGDIRTITSEARDTLNVISCRDLNPIGQAFQDCLNSN